MSSDVMLLNSVEMATELATIFTLRSVEET